MFGIRISEHPYNLQEWGKIVPGNFIVQTLL